MSYETRKMCLTNLGLQDKKPLSQKLIVGNFRFREFCAANWCFITYVYRTVSLQQHHLPHLDECACFESVEINADKRIVFLIFYQFNE